ncbi:MAG: hypothetical protein K6E91_04590 [Butyrivibrio sp.]|nr:hypothetical protein [Butyrivibrio sp.]
MGALSLPDLDKKYEGFYYPVARTYMGGANPEEDKKLSLSVEDYVVELTSDLKASIATFSILGAFDAGTGAFMVKDLKKYISLGTDVKILMGHSANVTEVFKGYVARVDFTYDFESPALAAVKITAMDIKGIMMANNSSRRLKANYYSDAVKEILDQSPYQTLKNNGIIDNITISDTPDKPPGGASGGETPDIRIEMVAESDYEFIAKTAKKFNFEFFAVGGNVAFRKAKMNTQVLMDIIPHPCVLGYEIGYDITGVVGEVKVRTLDIGKSKKIEVKKKNTGKVSLGSKAKPLISSQAYVYIDSAIESQKDAENRAEYILEDISYRLGHIHMELKGLPELVPGRFIQLKDFGDGISNKYYITDVTHEYYLNGNFKTTIEGKAATL